MNIRCYATLFILATSLTACASGTVESLNIRDWVGHKQTELVQSWGEPHHNYPLQDGGRAVGYRFANQAVTGPKGQVTFRMTNCMVNFEVDRGGIIEDAATTGKNCRIGPHDQMHPQGHPKTN